MPRKPRYDLPDVPQHIVHRGHNRLACFFTEADYPRYLGWLREAAAQFSCEIHGYVLMTNHVHLLVTPRAPDAVPKTMQHLGRRYVRYVNRAYRRSGKLWEGRYKASLIDPQQYLLACLRYIELNPVRAGMVQDAARYRWSSYRQHAHGEPDPVLTEHPVYAGLSVAREERCDIYRDLCRRPMDPRLLRALRDTVNHSHVLGDGRFKARMENLLDRKLGTGKPGRPRKTPVAEQYPTDSPPVRRRPPEPGTGLLAKSV